MKKLCLLLGLFTVFTRIMRAAEEYPYGPDSQRQPGVPQGTVTQYSWTSKIFPGTVRDYWVYVPAQYTPDKPACVMFFEDGKGTLNDGPMRVPIVFDNLIAKHEMPVTIAIMINPGVMKGLAPGQAGPELGPISGVAFGGTDHQYLHVVVGNDVFRRHLVRKPPQP